MSSTKIAMQYSSQDFTTMLKGVAKGYHLHTSEFILMLQYQGITHAQFVKIIKLTKKLGILLQQKKRKLTQRALNHYQANYLFLKAVINTFILGLSHDKTDKLLKKAKSIEFGHVGAGILYASASRNYYSDTESQLWPPEPLIKSSGKTTNKVYGIPRDRLSGKALGYLYLRENIRNDLAAKVDMADWMIEDLQNRDLWRIEKDRSTGGEAVYQSRLDNNLARYRANANNKARMRKALQLWDDAIKQGSKAAETIRDARLSAVSGDENVVYPEFKSDLENYGIKLTDEVTTLNNSNKDLRPYLGAEVNYHMLMLKKQERYSTSWTFWRNIMWYFWRHQVVNIGQDLSQVERMLLLQTIAADCNVDVKKRCYLIKRIIIKYLSFDQTLFIKQPGNISKFVKTILKSKDFNIKQKRSILQAFLHPLNKLTNDEKLSFLNNLNKSHQQIKLKNAKTYLQYADYLLFDLSENNIPMDYLALILYKAIPPGASVYGEAQMRLADYFYNEALNKKLLASRNDNQANELTTQDYAQAYELAKPYHEAVLQNDKNSFSFYIAKERQAKAQIEDPSIRQAKFAQLKRQRYSFSQSSQNHQAQAAQPFTLTNMITSSLQDEIPHTNTFLSGIFLAISTALLNQFKLPLTSKSPFLIFKNTTSTPEATLQLSDKFTNKYS